MFERLKQNILSCWHNNNIENLNKGNSKYKKYKQIIFVDVENVGYKLLNVKIQEDLYFFIFTSKKAYSVKNAKIINVKHIRNNVSNTSNCLDFCLITHMSEMISNISDKEIIVLSNDGGYDSAILYLKKKYPSLQIARYGMSINKYLFCYRNGELLKTLPSWMNLSGYILNKLESYDNMDDLKKNLSPKQKKKFVYSHKIVPISNIHINVSYDVYTRLYKVKAGEGADHYECYHKQLEDALKDCERIYNELSQISMYFQSHEQYKKAKKMKILPCVKEAAMKKQPLIYKLMENYDEEMAIYLFTELVNAC